MLLDTDITPPAKYNVPTVPAEHLEGDKIQPGHPLFGLVWINRLRVSGTPCFYGSRVPVSTLFCCFEAGQTLAEFLDDFEGVTKELALAVLELASSGLLAKLENL